MRKIAYQLLIASLFVVVLAPMAAWAQTEDHLNVDVPFQFRVGDVVLPAGKYLVQPLDESDPSMLVFRGINNHSVAIVPTVPAERSTHPDQSNLDFDKIGNREVLTKIWVGGQEEGYAILDNGAKAVTMAKSSQPATHSAKAKGSGM